MLIQCTSGNRQAPAVAMAYLIVKLGWAPWRALNVVAYGRPNVTYPPYTHAEPSLTHPCFPPPLCQIKPAKTAVAGLCAIAKGLVVREAKAREKRFTQLRMASLAGL